MKQKQKRKRGTAQYTLDFYTPLMQDECLARLRSARKNFTEGKVYLSANGDTFKIKFLGDRTFVSEQFEGRFEPYVAGTHICGKMRYTYHSETLLEFLKIPKRQLLIIGIIFVVLERLTDIQTATVIYLFVAMLLLLYLIMIFLRERYGKETTLLHSWLTEQLNAEEEAHETKAKA